MLKTTNIGILCRYYNTNTVKIQMKAKKIKKTDKNQNKK